MRCDGKFVMVVGAGVTVVAVFFFFFFFFKKKLSHVYMKHLTPTSRVAAHCINFSFFLNCNGAKKELAGLSSDQCGPNCNDHDTFCLECDNIALLH